MYYTVYKITNITNNKIYIGVHKTNDLNDGYMGSGKVLKRAIAKYGIENFIKEYISIFDNSEDMFNMESELVNEEFIKRLDTYNLKEGGCGGWDYSNTYIKNQTEAGRLGGKAMALKIATDEEYRRKHIERASRTIKKLHEEGRVPHSNTKGCNISEDHKLRIGRANSKHQTGEGNSQYNTQVVFNTKTLKYTRISKDAVIEYPYIKKKDHDKLKKEQQKEQRNREFCSYIDPIYKDYLVIGSLREIANKYGGKHQSWHIRFKKYLHLMNEIQKG